MTTSPVRPLAGVPPGPVPVRRRRRTAILLAGVVAAALVLSGSAGLVLGGLQAEEGGYFTSGEGALSTPTAALVTDEVLVESGRPGDPSTDVGDLSRVRVRVTTGTTPVFVGIGPKADVQAYLAGAAHDRMVRFRLDPFEVRYARTAGAVAPPPGGQDFWVATASGAGTQELLWDKARGPWSAVVMNADGSRGVDVSADVGLRFGFLLPLGAMLLGAGLLLAGALLLLAVTRRRPGAGTRW